MKRTKRSGKRRKHFYRVCHSSSCKKGFIAYSPSRSQGPFKSHSILPLLSHPCRPLHNFYFFLSCPLPLPHFFFLCFTLLSLISLFSLSFRSIIHSLTAQCLVFAQSLTPIGLFITHLPLIRILAHLLPLFHRDLLPLF